MVFASLRGTTGRHRRRWDIAVASAKPHLADSIVIARDLLSAYRTSVPRGDAALGDDAVWAPMLAEVAEASGGDLAALRLRA